jgi:hypothetical protein
MRVIVAEDNALLRDGIESTFCSRVTTFLLAFKRP